MKIYKLGDNPFNAVDEVINNGFVAIEGTMTQAVKFTNKVMEYLSAYNQIDPAIGYKNVQNLGYLYYVYDLNKFDISSKDLDKIIMEIDKDYRI